MTDTVAVLGLDGADYRLLNEWNCENILLDNHSKIETFTMARDFPLTREVWPAIATGELPGDGKRRGADWGGPTSLANRLAKRFLPMRWRSKIGIHLRSGPAVYQTDGTGHVFSDGAVHNWPGITPSHNWNRNSYWLQMLHAEKITTSDFRKKIAATGGMGIGWLHAMSQQNLPIAGCHVHQLDSAGHVWAERPGVLRDIYEGVDRHVGSLRDAVDTLVVISDHGMQSSVVDDQDPGEHSFRASIGTTVPGALPEHVVDVAEWLEDLKPVAPGVDDGSEIDTAAERLRDMGYIQ